MALATTCPQCKVSFKVVPDQLKLRRGLVRCGACQHVFSGVDYLRYVDDSKPRAVRAPPGAPDRASTEADLQTAFFLPETILATPRPSSAVASGAEPDTGPIPGPHPPAGAAGHGSATSEAAPAPRGHVDPAPMPAPAHGAQDRPGDEDLVDAESAIAYFSTGQRGSGVLRRHGALSVATVTLLALLLALQWTIAQRASIAARVPVVAPALGALFAPFGVAVGLPRDLDSVTIESFELQASATPGVLAMSALLRNRADHAVEWPSMQLTLTDPSNRVLVRKVIGPADYLRRQGAGAGLPPRAEWPLRLSLEAIEVEPAGYSVILFYP